MSLSHQVAMALAEQFYRWEVRGRGWAVWPAPVQLEPPFRPFEGHFLPRQFTEDDGQIQSAGSRFARGFGRLLGIPTSQPSAPPPEEIPEPEAEGVDEPEALVEFQIALPPDYQPQANVFEQFLFSIGYARGPVAFEVIGTPAELVVQITVHPADAEAVKRQLKAFFPEAIVIAGEQHLKAALLEAAGDFMVMDFGLEREFMVPINNLKALATDPLVAICGALDQLEEGEAGVFQVLLEPARHPWAASMVRAVSLGDGPFFANDPELLKQTQLKVTRPLYATVVRVAARATDEGRIHELIKALAGALRPLGHQQGNRLLPLNEEGYEIQDHLAALLRRQTHRPGMLLNSDELVALAHLPTAAVRAKSLRRVLRKTKAVPNEFTGEPKGVLLGTNEHEGVTQAVWLPDQIRLNHCHILGGTGSGKSTLLSLMAWQDILSGRGVAIIDPHGELVDLLIPHIPPERMQDVVLFDPTDEEYAIAFNPLAAASDRERELLATDFIAVMKQHTASWGDQMSSLLGNAVLAFLSSSKGGTLPELRRFLADEKFRQEFLKSVTNSEVVYFWENEAKLANKAAIGSILTRLDSLLRYESLLHILGQRANRLDFADIMDSGKIFLARLSKGLIGAENAYLLGSLLVSRFYQTIIARQSRSRDQRRPFFLLMDEAGDLLTSTISEILKGTRKYGLGLTLAHQHLAQLRNDGEVYSSVMGNCGTRVCFQVGGDDARKMADEFAGFTAADLMNQPQLHAVARIGHRDHDFNLVTRFIPEAERPFAEAYAEVMGETRKRYSTPRASIRVELAELRRTVPSGKGADPFAQVAAKQKGERERREQQEEPEHATLTSPPVTQKPSPSPRPTPPVPQPAPVNPAPPPKPPETPPNAPLPPPVPNPPPAATESTEAPETPELKSGKAEAVKNVIIQTAGSWGFAYETEFPILGGAGRVDVVLTLQDRRIACEISATTTPDQEVGHLLNCLSAGFTEIISVCDATVRRRRIESLLRTRLVHGQDVHFHFLTLRQLQTRIADAGRAAQKSPGTYSGGKAIPAPVILTRDEQEATALRQLAEIRERRARAKAAKNRPPGSQEQ